MGRSGSSHRFDDEVRAEFFRLVDQGLTVRAAVKVVGVSEGTGYWWRRQVGISVPRRKSRKYTAEDKAEFFRRLETNRSVTAVARELGFVRITCFKWAHEAGIFTSRDANVKKEEFLRLRALGVPRAQAARKVGAASRSATDWDLGIKQIKNGRLYPDGRVVRYNVNTTPSSNPYRASDAPEIVASMSELERVINPRFINLTQRERIYDLRNQGASIRSIARDLGKAPSTISRELIRNTNDRVGYLPYAAHRASTLKRRRPKRRKLHTDGPLRDYVDQRLAKRWSPQQISARMVKDFPHDQRMRVSTETVYQGIYVHAKGSLKRDFVSPLRKGRNRRTPRRSPVNRSNRFINPMTLITERPVEVDSREVPGHWEGDLIVGKLSRSAIATLVERNTRFTMLAYLGTERSGITVSNAIAKALTVLPEKLRQTLTWDQGAEMSEHTSFTLATNMNVYFCEAASPWQRGTNENTNGLLRQDYPKGTDLSKYPADHLQYVANELNERPRKALNWDTPAERIYALLQEKT
jgi:IS30 family transposase